MRYIFVEPSTQVAFNNNEIVVFSSHKKRYIKFILNKESKFIMNYFREGNYFENFIIDVPKSENPLRYISFVNILIRKGVLNQVEISNDNYILPGNRIPHQAISKRYSHQNLYIESRFFTRNSKGEHNFKNYDFTMKLINKKHITIIGLGGVGSFLATFCVAAGVGKLTLIDGDKVELSNLSRQIFYKENDVNKEMKVDSLKKFLNNLNSSVKVVSHPEYIYCYQDAIKLIDKCDLIVQCGDFPPGKIDRIINEYSMETKIPVLFIHNGSVGPLVIPGITADYKKFEEYLNEESKGNYQTIIENFDKNFKTAYPTVVHGVLGLTQYAFDKIFEFLILGNEIDFKNQIYFEEDRKKFDFVRREYFE